ncbi:MAG: serine/threonine-protein kinase, partial [Gemmatimonadales bacterium]
MSADLRAHLQASLGGAYAIERELGGGGMSRVFVALETRLGRRVVVKLLRPDLAPGVSADRFEREIRVAAQLQDPRIVPVLHAGDAGGIPYYTMPLVEGESLRSRIARGPVPLGEAVAVLRDIALALECAHDRGVVHRDIKPENVLLSGRTAMVTDFGIAKAIAAAAEAGSGDTLTDVGTVLGTPAYMAPEQVAGGEVDHRADLYAWGVVAYEVLAGTHPFADKATPQAV